MHKRCLLLLLVLMYGTRSLNAGDKSAFSFLYLAPTPRAASLGEAYVAVADGPETIYYNPAGLARQTEKHFYIQSFLPPLIENIQYNNFIFTQPTTYGGWGAQIGFLNASGFTRTVADASNIDGFRETGSFSAYDLKASAGAATKIWGEFSAGANLGVVRESLDNISATNGFLDAGIFYQDEPLQWGFALQNLGPPVKFQNDSFPMPIVLRTGFALIQPQKSFVPFVPEKSFFTTELFRPLYDHLSIKFGVEVPFMDERVKFRGGYQYYSKNPELALNLNVPNGLSMGFGLAIGQWQIDFATVAQGDLGFSHRMALDLKWSATNPKQKP